MPSIDKDMFNLKADFLTIKKTQIEHLDKTNYMLFTRSQMERFTISTISGPQIEKVICYKYEGIWFSEK